MRTILFISLTFLTGCRGIPAGLVVTGSAYVETDRPEGKAVAKVEVQYRPPVSSPRENRKVHEAETAPAEAHAAVAVRD